MLEEDEMKEDDETIADAVARATEYNDIGANYLLHRNYEESQEYLDASLGLLRRASHRLLAEDSAASRNSSSSNSSNTNGNQHQQQQQQQQQQQLQQTLQSPHLPRVPNNRIPPDDLMSPAPPSITVTSHGFARYDSVFRLIDVDRPPNHDDILVYAAVALFNLALGYQWQDCFTRAAEVYQTCLGFLVVRGSVSKLQPVALNNCALCLWELGHLEAAKAMALVLSNAERPLFPHSNNFYHHGPAEMWVGVETRFLLNAELLLLLQQETAEAA